MNNKYATSLLIVGVIVSLSFMSYLTIAQDTTLVVTNNGPIVAGNEIIFSASCSGNDTRLVVCQSSSCSTTTQPQDIVCISSLSNGSEKSCTYASVLTDVGVYSGTGVCCDSNEVCGSPVGVNWIINNVTEDGLLVVDELNNNIEKIVTVDGETTEVILTTQPITKILFTNLSGAQLGISSTARGIIEPENIAFVKTYAFDLESLSFDQAVVHATAEATQLYTCIFWDFELSICLGSWDFVKTITPQTEYTLNLESGTVAFAEGNYLVQPQEPLVPTLVVSNSGPVVVSETIVFSGVCNSDSRLIICRDGVLCSGVTQPQDIICVSELSTTAEKSCSYESVLSDVGVHNDAGGVCCDGTNVCDEAVVIEDWTINEPVATEPVEQLALPTNITTAVAGDQVTQEQVEINKPVKWVKKVRLDQELTAHAVVVPSYAEDIKVHKIVNQRREEVQQAKLKISKVGTDTEIVVEDLIKDVDVEYFSAPPSVKERFLNKYKKEIVVFSDIHYTNILAYTTIPDVKQDRVRLYHVNGSSKTLVTNVVYKDTNGDGLVDLVEWIVPFLSNQTYIIEIVKADHLDVNRNFINDIYDAVKALDNNWSEAIFDGDYVRVVFEKPLTAENDITLYPRTVNGTPRIEVYAVNGTEVIAEFTSLNDNEYNQVFLTNLPETQDTFDLKVIGGSVEFDHIIDPLATAIPTGTEIVLRPQGCTAQSFQSGGQFLFDISCDGNYPGACSAGNDHVSCDDNNVEDNTAGRQTGGGGGPRYGGVNLTYVNETITDCTSITDVQICYRVYITANDGGYTCNIAVNNDEDATFATVGGTFTCPSNGEPSTTTCRNATASEVWACADFFDTTSGSRAQAVAQASDQSGGGNSDTFNVEELYFNVTYLGPTVAWNQSTFDFGTVDISDGNATGFVSISSNIFNNNVAVVCSSGDCANIDQNWTTRNMNDGQSDEVKLTCSDATAGTFQAIFNVTSDEDTIANQLTVDCVITTTNTPPVVNTVNLSTPEFTNLTTQNLTVTFNVTDGQNDKLYNITDWRLEGTSLAVLNMPFNTNVSSTASGAVLDYSTYGNNGTLTNGPVWNTSGKVGGVYEFDGDNDLIDVGSDPSLEGMETLTITAWVKWKGASRAAEETFVSNWVGSGDRTYLFRWDSQDAAITFQLQNSADTEATPVSFTNTDISDKEWHHVAAIYNGTHTLVYLDGIVSPTLGVLTGTTDISTQPTHIGDSPHQAADAFLGAIDEVFIFNRSLSSQQILSMYTDGIENHSVQKIVSQETTSGDNWTVAVTSTDSENDSATVLSHNLEIIAVTVGGNITACQDLDETGAKYTLINDITTTGTCFNITANHVVLDGQSFSITGDDDSVDYGVVAIGRINVTVKNLNITDFGDGIRFELTNDSFMQNNNVTSNSNYGIYLTTSATNNTITNNTAKNNLFDGITLTSSNNNTIIRNTVNGNSNKGIFLVSSNNNIITNNTVNSNGDSGIYLSTGSNFTIIQDNIANSNIQNGIYISFSYNNTLQDNTANNNTLSGIFIATSSDNNITDNKVSENAQNGIRFFSDSDNNIITNLTINGSKQHAISIEVADDFIPENNIFTNITINNTNAAFNDLKVSGALNGTQFINTPIANYSFDPIGNLVTFEDSAYGIIQFLSPINGSGTNLANDIQISFNNVSVDSSTNEGLNRSANITLYNTPGGAFTTPQIQRDGANCTSGCTNLTALDAATVIFNVSDWTSYGLGEGGAGGNITACQDLDVAGATYTLQNDVSTTGTCFNITADNIVLDGQGFNVDGDDSGTTDFGVKATGRTNITVKNLNITDFVSSIRLVDTNNSLISNNTLFSASSRSINADGDENNITIVDNIIKGAGLSAISIAGNRFNVTGNTILENGAGISGDNIDDSIIELNTIKHNSGSNAGIIIRNRNTVQHNILENNSGSALEVNGNNNLFFNNTLNVNTAIGILVGDFSDHNRYINISINGSGGNAIDINSAVTNPKNTTFNNVNISNTDVDSFDLKISPSSSNFRTTFIDTPIANYTINTNGEMVLLTIENSSAGIITFLTGVNGSGTNLSKDIQISFNNVSIDSSENEGLNRSANITLYNTPGGAFTTPQIERDGANCTSGCTNLTALDIATVVFNVTAWTSYGLGEGAAGGGNPTVVGAIFGVSGPTLPSQSVTENSITEVLVSFTVSDADGVADIDDSSANLTLRRALVDVDGALNNVSTNTTCFNEADVDSTTANFTCVVQLHYWFVPGEWNFTAGVRDTSGVASVNSSNFTVASTSAMVISLSSFDFGTLVIGQENSTSVSPIVVNNTANAGVVVVNVQAVDLVGEVTVSDTIGANNFSVDVDTGGVPPAECTAATELVNASATAIANSVLASGNRSFGEGNETLYPCFRIVPQGLSPQAYSTLNGTAWTVSV